MALRPVDHILRIRGLIKKRPGAPGYRLVIPALEVKIKEKVALVGNSGSGKSTALDLLALILKPETVETFTWFTPDGDKIDLAEAWRQTQADKLARLRLDSLGYVLQTGGLLPFLKVRENILLPARIKGLAGSGAALAELGERLKISHLFTKYPAQLSVGERQRCAIARAVIHRPRLILADEPTAALDPPTAGLVFELLLELSCHSTLIVATHEPDRVAGAGFRVLRINCPPREGGRTVEAVLREPGPARLNGAKR